MSIARSAPSQSIARNRLLGALPAGDLARLAPHLERVPLPRGWVVYEPGAAQAHLYFPTTGIVSLTYRLEGRGSAEIGMVGNDGVVGIALFMGGETTPRRAVVQSAGEGYRLSATACGAKGSPTPPAGCRRPA